MSIEWNGEGLPPLGCICEIAEPIYNAGTKVRVLCHDENAAVCRILEGDRLHSLCQLEATEIRPLRTEAERKREEALKDLAEALGHAHGLFDLLAIYKAIQSGKVRHITLK